MKRVPIAIPILASLAAFILILLALLAGSKPGYMESYDILTFNTSGLGQNLVSGLINNDDSDSDSAPTPTSTDDDSICNEVDGVLGRICGSATSAAASVQSEVVEKLDDMTGDVAGELADRLGIHEFYSLHVLAICHGDFSRSNATAPGAGRNVSWCRNGLKSDYNITAVLARELRAGPLTLNLADLGFTEDLNDAMDMVNDATKALAILFIVSTALVGLSFLASLLAVFAIPGQRERPIRVVNVVVATLAMVVLVVSCILATVASQIVESKVNDMGDEIGLRAKAGTGFLALSWVAAALFVLGVFGFWIVQGWRWRAGGRRSGLPRGHGVGEKYVRDSEDTRTSTNGIGPGRRGTRWPGGRI